MELIVTRADNSNYNLPSENSKITSAVQTRTLMGEDTVEMTVQSVGYINFLIGDWIEVFGRKYTLNTLGEPQRIGENTFEYNLVFEGVNYELTKVVYRSADYSGFNPTSDFPLTGTAEAFLTVLQYNLERAFGQGVWAIGSFPATEAKTLSFTSENCLLALNRVCSEFGLEYEIKTIGGVKTINLGAVGDTLPLNLEYGKGKGLYSLTRTNVDSKNIVTRLYVEGSDRNVKAGYRDNALRLRIASNAESCIDSPSVASFGVIEGSKIFEDIFPHREGTVSAINASDLLEFTDSSMDFDLAETDSNGTKWLIAGQPAKIHFNTGALAGYEFELTAYNHSTKTFKLKPFKDERGLQFPNPDSAAFQIKTGDKYVILDIIMPDSYIQAAEAELLARAQEYLSQNDQPRVEYSLDLDRFFLKSMFSGPGFDVNFLDAGDYLHIKDSKIGVDKEVRVKTFTRDVLDPWAYQVALSDVIEPTRIELLLADTLETKKAARQSKLFDPARSRRNWRDVEEVAGMVDTLRAEVALIGSPEGQFQLDSFFEVNKGGNPDSFGATAGVLAHDAFEGDAGGIWNIGAFDVALSNSGAYYLYAQCSRVNTGAVFTVSLTKIGVEDVGGYYHFPVGIISSVKDNARTLTTVYGYTLISGNNINTGIIQNQLSGIYINLQTGEIRGNIKFTSGVSVENAITDQQIYIEYSVNGSTNWHTTFTAGDLYMRQKKGAGAWSAAIRIVGEAGAAGATGPEGRYTDYQFAKNTSATTAPTSGWQDSPPAVSAGEYVWMRTGEVVPPATSPSSWSTATRVTGDKGAKGADGRSVTGTDVEFAQSTSATVAPTSGWQTTAPAWESGKYIWHRTKTTYSTGDPTYSAAVNLTGSPGSTGSTGATGTGVDSITEEYYLSTSKTTQAGGSWSVNPPTWEMGKYMWTRVKIVYKDPASTVYTTPVVSSEWEAVDAVQVGGRNLFVEGTAIEGKYITHTDGTLGNSSSHKVSDFIEVQPNQEYIFSVGNRYLYYSRYAFYDESHSFIKGVLTSGIANTVTFKSPNNAKYVRVSSDINTGGSLLKLEKGNKATDWTPAPEDVDADIATAQTAANSANTAVGNLSGYVDGAFKDGVIDTAEAKAIEKYKNNLSETKLSVDGSYTKLYNNAYLTGTPKSNLSAAKTALNTAYTNLVNSINTAIADGKTTAAEKSDVDSRFGLFNTALATYRVRVEEANAAIQIAVEGAAKAYTDSIEFGGRNYALGTSTPKIKNSWSGANNQGLPLYAVNVAPEWEVGKQVIIAFDVDASGIAWSGGALRIASQSYGDVTSHDGFGYYNFLSRTATLGSGASLKTRVVYQLTLTAAMLTNQRYTFTVRCDYVTAGSLSIKNFALFYGNKAPDWTPAPEDAPVQLEYLTQALQGTTEIDGGLILASVLAARDSGGSVRSYQNGDPALNDIAFAAGVENFGVSGETQNIALKHSGAAKIGAFSVSDTGEIELIDPSTQAERLRFATVNLPSISSLYNGVDYSGTPSIGAGSTSGTQTLTGSFTIAHNGVTVNFNSGTVAITGTGRSYGGGLASFARAEVALYRGSTLIASFGSAQIHFSGTTSNSDSLSSPISARSIILNAGTYTFRLLCTSNGDVTTKNATSTAFTGSYSYNLRNVKRQQYGLDGMMLFYSDNHFHFTENGGLDARAETNKWNAPGALLGGRMGSAGIVTNWWGAKVGSGSGKTSTAGEYQINHTIGHLNYFISATPTTDVRLRITAKTENYFRIRSSSSADVAFDYVVIGNNY